MLSPQLAKSSTPMYETSSHLDAICKQVAPSSCPTITQQHPQTQQASGAAATNWGLRFRNKSPASHTGEWGPRPGNWHVSTSSHPTCNRCIPLPGTHWTNQTQAEKQQTNNKNVCKHHRVDGFRKIGDSTSITRPHPPQRTDLRSDIWNTSTTSINQSTNMERCVPEPT